MDWTALAEQLRTLRPDGEVTSSEDYGRAIEVIVGPELIRSAVEHYVAGRPGMSLARGVLTRLQPPSAMTLCYEIFRNSDDIEARRAAVDLLRDVANRDALKWIDQFLADSDQGIQNYGLGIVEQLLWRGVIGPEECEVHLARAEQHNSEGVRDAARRIRERAQRAGS